MINLIKPFRYIKSDPSTYLMQYRNVGIFYEHLVNRILDDLVDMLKPKSMRVSGDFSSRGGIDTTVSADYKKT